MKCLFVLDPMKSLQLNHDTSFALMREAHKRKYGVFHSELSGLVVQEGFVSAYSQQYECKNESYQAKGKPTLLGLDHFDIVLMRKDPPVDSNFLHAVLILLEAERTLKVKVLNSPSALLAWNEKLGALRFIKWMPKHFISSNTVKIKEWVLAQKDKVVLKPLDGFGGRGIFVTSSKDSNLGVILETLNGKFVMAQTYLPAIKTQGDKRIIFINGEAVGAVTRMPQSENEHRGNLAVGAKAVAGHLSPEEKKMCLAIGDELRAAGIYFAGIDVIGDSITEVNVTSPTGFQEIQTLSGIDCAKIFFDKL